MLHHNSGMPEPIAPKLGIRIPQLMEGVKRGLAETGGPLKKKGGVKKKTNVGPIFSKLRIHIPSHEKR